MSEIIERSIIGAILLDSNCIKYVYNKLESNMFSCHIEKDIYTAISQLYMNSEDITINSIMYQADKGKYDKNFIFNTLKACMLAVSTTYEIKNNAELLIKEHKARLLKNILNNTSLLPKNIDSEIGLMMFKLEELQGNKSNNSRSIKDIVKEQQDLHFCEKENDNLFTGIKPLDNHLGSLKGGDVIVIGARPGVGKSAISTQILCNMAEKGINIGYFNLEMKESQVYQRLVARYSGIDMKRIINGKHFLNNEEERYKLANKKLASMDFRISTCSNKISNIVMETKCMNYDIIVIDYLQLIMSDEKRLNRVNEVGDISKAIKSLAMSLNIPVILLSQLNRTSTQRPSSEPTMAELRESGDIEQDASIIILMWNPDDKDEGKKGVKIDKNRNGTKGSICLRFDGAHMTFNETDESLNPDENWKKVKGETPFG